MDTYHFEILWSWADACNGAVWDIFSEKFDINDLAWLTIWQKSNLIIMELIDKWHEKSHQNTRLIQKIGYKIITSVIMDSNPDGEDFYRWAMFCLI